MWPQVQSWGLHPPLPEVLRVSRVVLCTPPLNARKCHPLPSPAASFLLQPNTVLQTRTTCALRRRSTILSAQDSPGRPNFNPKSPGNPEPPVKQAVSHPKAGWPAGPRRTRQEILTGALVSAGGKEAHFPLFPILGEGPSSGHRSHRPLSQPAVCVLPPGFLKSSSPVTAEPPTQGSASPHPLAILGVSCSVISDSLNPWTVARQAPLSMGFSR